MANDDYPIANADEARDAVGGYKQKNLFLLCFGAYGGTCVYTWDDHLQDAFETAVEWLDDEGHCGIFTTVTQDDIREAAEELFDGDELKDTLDAIKEGDFNYSGAAQALEQAEADLTVIGHTSLTNCEKKLGGGPLYIPNWEWTGSEVHGKDFDDVLQRSFEEIYEDQVEGPGKFEGESVYVPYLYEEEGADEEFTGHSELALGWLGRYDIDDDDRRRFADLKGRRVVYLFERSDGFVQEIKPEGADELIKDMEASWEDDEETG